MVKKIIDIITDNGLDWCYKIINEGDNNLKIFETNGGIYELDNASILFGIEKYLGDLRIDNVGNEYVKFNIDLGCLYEEENKYKALLTDLIVQYSIFEKVLYI